MFTSSYKSLIGATLTFSSLFIPAFFVLIEPANFFKFASFLIDKPSFIFSFTIFSYLTYSNNSLPIFAQGLHKH